jgi:hypothetical protein
LARFHPRNQLPLHHPSVQKQFQDCMRTVLQESNMSTPILALWINGQHTRSRSSRFADVTNPASGEVIRQVPLANREDVESAVAAARAAFPG